MQTSLANGVKEEAEELKLVFFGNEVSIPRIEPLEGMDRGAAGAPGLVRRRIRKPLDERGSKDLNDLGGSEGRHSRNDSRNAQGDAAFHITENATGKIKLVEFPGGKGKLFPTLRGLHEGVHQIRKTQALMRDNLRQQNIQNTTILSIHLAVQGDSPLHVGVVAALQGRSIFVRVIREHIAGSHKDGKLRLDIRKVTKQPTGLLLVALRFTAHAGGTVSHGGVEAHKSAEAVSKGAMEILLINEVIKVPPLGPILTQ